MDDAAGEERITLGAAAGLLAIVAATFVAITTEIVPVGLLPQLSRAFSVPAATAGLLVTVYAVLVAVLALPLTRLIIPWPRKPLLLATIGVYSLGNLLIALAPNFAVVCAGRALGGIAHAVFFSLSAAYAASLVPERMQGRALAIAASGASLGYVLGVPLMTSIGAALQWRAAFGALAVGGVLAALLTGLALPAQTTPAFHSAERAPGPRSALVKAAAVNALVFFGQYALYTYVSPVLLQAGVPETAIGPALFLFGAAGVIGLWLAGLTIDRRPRAGFVAALFIASACTAALPLLHHSTSGTVTATTLWLMTFGAIPVFCTAACIRTRALSAELSSAVNNAASNAGIASGAAVGGIVFALTGISGTATLTVVAFAGSALLVLLLRTAFPKRAHPAGSPDA